ncbi:MAG: indolepyruvate ferredoxin oxidoreductase subunit alpha [Thermoplasmata archaeon]|nr:MAG: indolepyruvate ferredoxin oxidoreductase subunit alpha [Thermoplasmata archaeon]
MMVRIWEDAPGKRVFMLGNEAIARGAVEAGVQVAASYPGTPASEIMENLAEAAKHLGFYAQWSINETVAFNVAVGAAITGARAMASMKNAGLNWIMDMLMTVDYTGVRGGLVLAVGDDPDAHYSSNEQDTRIAGEYALIPVLEPSTVHEAKEMTKKAFEISEAVELPVQVRSCTRISHASGDVVLGEIRRERNPVGFNKHYKLPYRWDVYGPPGPVEKHKWLFSTLPKQKELSEESEFNWLDIVDGSDIAVVGSGIGWAYAKDALKEMGLWDRVSKLKVGFVHPAPEGKLERILRSSSKVLFVEEGLPFVERKAYELAKDVAPDVEIYGKLRNQVIEPWGELNLERVSAAISRVAGIEIKAEDPAAEARKKGERLIIPRSSMLCPGCQHLGTYWALKTALARFGGKVPIINGDIGCYEQGGYGVSGRKIEPNEELTKKYVALAPYEMLDTLHIMGSGIGLAQGEYHAGYREGKIVAVSGDSTFFHAVMPSLLNAVYNKANILYIIMDNDWVAMTGHQPSPSTGLTATGQVYTKANIYKVVKSLGVKFVEVVDPYDIKGTTEVLQRALQWEDGPAVVIAKRECALQVFRRYRKERKPVKTYRVVEDKCIGCKLCVYLGCPAVWWKPEKKKAVIDPIQCVGCSMCAQVCPVNAIVPEEEGYVFGLPIGEPPKLLKEGE